MRLQDQRPDDAASSGLSSAEAARRLDQFGANEPVQKKSVGSVVEFLILFSNPLILILIVASSVSAFLGDLINAAIIIAMVLIGVLLNFLQTRRSKKAAEALRKEVGLTATVLRDAEWRDIARREVVPGDVIRLSAGDLVPADAGLVNIQHLHVQESVLTGESLPVEKETNSCIFMGTSVISGVATARVTETGPRTKFGEIAARLTEKTPETEFERGTRRFGFFMMRTILVLVVFVFVANAVMHRDLLESLLFSIALAVGLTPEFLPMITAVTLGQGAVRMAKQKVIVKHLEAIQNFGSIDILCSDKTGTLTTGEMALRDSVNAFGGASELPFLMGYVNSYFETGILHPAAAGIRAAAAENPLDDAILQHGMPAIAEYRKLNEIPFDFERRRVSVVVAAGDRRMLITKGAPENILDVCTHIRDDKVDISLTAERRETCAATYCKFSEQGLRVIAVAFADVDQRDSYGAKDETGLTLAGFLTFADEPLATAARALTALKKDGVTFKMITGDNDLVARYVCSQVGVDGGRIVLGDDIDRMNDAALGKLAEEASVFARVSPIQKNRIILALKTRGHVVGYMGDGINDAPSLRTADVGISVSTATDVARDAAEIVLMERSLAVLHNGMIEGRRSFGNVMKYLLMGTSSNFGNMFSMAAAVLFLPFLPMLPAQIILNNFLYDLAQITIPTDRVDPTFIRKPRRWDVSLIRKFMLWIGPVSSIYDFATFFALLYIFRASEQFFHTGWFVESLATQTLVVFVIRTVGNPLRSRPSRALATTVIAVVISAVVLPYTPLGTLIGFVPLPWTFLFFVAFATATYLLLVEVIKRRLMARWLDA